MAPDPTCGVSQSLTQGMQSVTRMFAVRSPMIGLRHLVIYIVSTAMRRPWTKSVLYRYHSVTDEQNETLSGWA
jgi:hypothetical protein